MRLFLCTAASQPSGPVFNDECGGSVRGQHPPKLLAVGPSIVRGTRAEEKVATSSKGEGVTPLGVRSFSLQITVGSVGHFACRENHGRGQDVGR